MKLNDLQLGILNFVNDHIDKVNPITLDTIFTNSDVPYNLTAYAENDVIEAVTYLKKHYLIEANIFFRRFEITDITSIGLSQLEK